MRSATLYPVLICLTLILAGCEDESVRRDYPRVRTLDVTGITEEGALFTAEVYEPGNARITEHGFVWAMSNPQLEYDNKIFLGSFNNTGLYNAEIHSTLKEGVKYKVTAFVKSGDYTVYGNTVEFTSLGSLGPQITDLLPDHGILGDTILIKGRNFSWVPGTNQVYFNNIQGTVCNPISDTALLVSVPFTLSESENIIGVEIAGNRTTFTLKPFIADLPEIYSFTPSAAYWLDTVEVFIKNLRNGLPLILKVGDKQASITSSFNGTALKFIMPEAIINNINILSVSCYEYNVIAGETLQLLPPVIERFFPKHGNWSDPVTLYGHFNPSLSGTSVLMGGKQATVISVSTDSIKFKLPVTYFDTTGAITYNYNNWFSSISQDNFLIDKPEVISFSPLSGYQGQTVNIRGRNFNPSSSSVKFNSTTATVISRSDSLITCKVPAGLVNPVSISVTAGIRTAITPEEFSLLVPSITSFTPTTVATGDTITIYGEKLSQETVLSLLDGHFAQVPLTYLSVSENSIRAVIPDCTFTSGKIYGKAYEYSFSSATDLNLPEPVIYSLMPSSGAVGEVITITGANFSRVPSYNRIIFEYGSTTAISSTRTELQFIIPNLPGGTNAFAFQTAGWGISSPVSLTVTGSPWENLPYMLFQGWRPALVSMAFEDEVYLWARYETYYQYNLYRYNPATRRFDGVGAYKMDNPYFSSCLVKGKDAYFFTDWYSPKLMRFNADEMKLSVVSNYPGAAPANILMLDGDSVMYAGGGRRLDNNPNSIKDFYKYNYSTGTWTRLNDLPGFSGGSSEFTVNGRHYILTSDNKLYEYNPLGDSWTRRADPTEPFYSYRMAKVCLGKVYVGYGEASYNQISCYDPEADKWTQLEGEIPRGRQFPFSFEWKDEIYFGGGWANDWLGDMWKYNPAEENK